MIVYSLLTITVCFALLSLYLLWCGRKLPIRENSSSILLAISLAVVVYLYGVWVFISVYVKYVFGACFLALLLFSLFSNKSKADHKTSPLSKAVNYLVSVLLLIMTVLYYTGTAGKPYGVIDLQLPFRSGTYFVFQGGRGLPTNVFHATGRHTLFAMDIIKLNRYGNRADHIFSKDLNDYEIFGDTIYSPCAGTILKTENNNPDNIPPLRKRGPTNTNQLLIETDKAYVFIGHLKHNCVFVKAGDEVIVGQALGLAGNSGMSLEPHLHIQAHAKNRQGLPWYTEPQLLIQFGGKSYLLFDEIKAQGR